MPAAVVYVSVARSDHILTVGHQSVDKQPQPQASKLPVDRVCCLVTTLLLAWLVYDAERVNVVRQVHCRLPAVVIHLSQHRADSGL